MISAIFVYNLKGDVLISRLYRHDLRRSVADAFRIQVISNPESNMPVLTIGSTTFLHIKHENLYIVAITRVNANAALVFEFLQRIVSLGTSYFGRFDEESVKDNFVLIYELLDEIMDFGWPQNCDLDPLRQYITTEGVKSTRRGVVGGFGASLGKKDNSKDALTQASKITAQAVGATPWRRPNIKYRKNEAFVDVIEEVNALQAANGTILRADVSGKVQMRAYLSGQPTCKFGLNDRLVLTEQLNPGSSSSAGGNAEGLQVTKRTKAVAGSITLDDCQFHQCVGLERFESDRTISFVPPDGEFELMRYRAQDNINLPFRVHPIVNELSKTKVEYRIAVKANFAVNLSATDVCLSIPTPLNAANVTCRVSQGKAKWEPASNSIEWKILKFVGGAEYVLSAEADLTQMTVLGPSPLSSSTSSSAPDGAGTNGGSGGGGAEAGRLLQWSRPPISLKFQLVMFTSSGLIVRYLKIAEPQLAYNAVKWVRYLTKNGSYEIRIA